MEGLVALPPEEDFIREAEAFISRLSYSATPAAAAAAADADAAGDRSSSSSTPKWIKQLGDVYESLVSATLLSSGFSLEVRGPLNCPLGALNYQWGPLGAPLLLSQYLWWWCCCCYYSAH